MKLLKFKIFVATIGAILISSSSSVFLDNAKTFADSGKTSTITVSPMNYRIILMPGEEYKSSIKITNPATSNTNLEYSLSIGSFSQTSDDNSIDDYGTEDLDTVTIYNQIMEWITFEKESGIVAPNDTDIVEFTINVPKDAPAGGQYATIIATDNTDRSDRGNGNVQFVSIPRIASIIYAEVAGTTREEGKILDNTMPSILFDKTLNATSMVRNDGNVHTDAKYVLQIWPIWSDEEICTNEENVSTSLVMPNTERYHTESCTLPPVGIFKAKQTVEIFGEISTLEKTIIVCPLWLMFVVIFAITAIIIYFVVRAKSRKRRIE